jgi:hypothetical protein
MAAAPEQHPNVRANRYYIVRSDAGCPRCGAWNALVALMVPPAHEVRWDEGNGEDPVARIDWESMPCCALLFHIESLPGAVERRLLEYFPHFKRGAARGSRSGCWANHCAHCNHPWPDEDCFCEPGGAFLPVAAEGLEKLRVIAIEEPLCASVGGYAPDPDFMAGRLAP